MGEEGIKKKITIWMQCIFMVLLVLFIIVFVRVILLQSDEELHDKIASLKVHEIQPMRGDICAYDGRILATSIPTYSVHWDLSVPGLKDSVFYKYVDTLAVCVSKLFGDSSSASYSKRFRTAYKKKSKYLLVHDKVTLTQLSTMRTFPIFKKGRYRSGFISEQKFIRELPHKSLAARAIGFYSPDKKEYLVGMEQAYNDILTGSKGEKLMMKTGSGEWYPVNAYNEELDKDPVDGCDIISTIDVNLQDIVEKSLSHQLMQNHAKYGTVVVMEVKTGKIRAISNLKLQENGTCVEEYNYAVGTRSEPGSTFKLASAIAYLEQTGAEITDSIYMGDGKMKIADKEIVDDHDFHGYMTIKEIIEKSSNVGTAKMILNTFKDNPEDYVDRLYKMGLNKKVGIELMGEPDPVIKYPGDKDWYKSVSLCQMAYGYETLLTPLQILTFYNAIANNGKTMRPYIVESIRSHGETIKTISPEVINSAICSKETIQKVQKMLEGVVERGTASNIKSKYYGIAGKTGTAQIANGKSGYIGEKGKTYMASFAGYFPTDNPKYSCIVVISAPQKGSYYATSVACPVFKKIADKLYSQDRELHYQKNFDLLKQADNIQIPNTKSGDREILDRLLSTFNIQVELDNKNDGISQYVYTTASQNKKLVKLEDMQARKGYVPDVRGMGLRDAMYLLKERGLEVNVIGRGTVKKQSIPPATQTTAKMRITIELG